MKQVRVCVALMFAGFFNLSQAQVITTLQADSINENTALSNNLLSEESRDFGLNMDISYPKEAGHPAAKELEERSFAAPLCVNSCSKLLFCDIPLPLESMISIYDISGRKVGERQIIANEHSISLSAFGLQKGIYFYQIAARGEFIKRDKIVVSE